MWRSYFLCSWLFALATAGLRSAGGRVSSHSKTNSCRLLASTTGTGDSVTTTAVHDTNMRYLLSIGIRDEACDILLSDERMANISIKEREKELRHSIGMSRDNLKQSLNNYPTLAVDILADLFLKTSKDIMMKSLNITDEADYDVALKKIQKQSSKRKGFLFFRGNVKFLIAFLKTELGLELPDLQKLFKLYPTFFTLEEKFLKKRIIFLIKDMHYSCEQLKKICIENSRFLLYSESRYVELRTYFRETLQLDDVQFCYITAKFPRLLSVSLATIRSKIDHMTDSNAWRISAEDLKHLVLIAPTILTTPRTTTEGLYRYLDEVLGFSPSAVAIFIRKYPGFLRVNPRTVERNVDYLVLCELVLIFFMNNVLPIDTSGVYSSCGDNNGSGEIERSTILSENIRALYRDLGGQLLLTAGLSCTCSLERIADRVDRTTEALLRANDVGNVDRNIEYIKSGLFRAIRSRADRRQSSNEKADDNLVWSVGFIENLVSARSARGSERVEEMGPLLSLWSHSRLASGFYTKPKNIALNEKAFARTIVNT